MKEKNKRGRPTDYTPELADKICDLTATHTVGYSTIQGLYPDLPEVTTFYRWRLKYPEFRHKYLEAKKLQIELKIEENDELLPKEILYVFDEYGNKKMDSASVSAVIAKLNNRKWEASKLLPKVYGDGRELERKTEENEELKEKLRVLREQLAEQNKKDY